MENGSRTGPAHCWGRASNRVKRPRKWQIENINYRSSSRCIQNDNLELSIQNASSWRWRGASKYVGKKTAARVFCVDRKAQKKSVESLVKSSQPVTVLFEEYSNYLWIAFTIKIDFVLVIFWNTVWKTSKNRSIARNETVAWEADIKLISWTHMVDY